MGIFFGFQSCLCAGSGEIFFAVENQEQSFMLQKSVENFTAQQNTLLHSRKLRKACYAIENAEMSHCRKMQKTLPHHRKLRRVNLVAETREKFLLWQKWRTSPICSVFLWTLDSFCTQISNGRIVPQSPFCGALGPTYFLEKAQTKRHPITSRCVSKVQET